ncbi:CDGSH iron-sulfur domain-containing protein [Methanomassiliicoccus luminyensis]|uniref:CDGSH iron-sulfur domain-containing protein n=1 Tax=Methanomassiliicoccus luminyensis TaxID=1080712 RepID=UPI0009DB4758|nr:CDGSH iron-sulfur domain-containing protein [Methanomassiliicoccus luminyensis]
MARGIIDRVAQRIKIMRNGPYVVSGDVPLDKQITESDDTGSSVGWKAGEKYPEQGEEYRLCRCGQSGNKPFCDETHHMVDFDGTETADRKSYADSCETLEGPRVRLTDRDDLCAVARYCHGKGNGDAWDLAQRASTDQEVREAVDLACSCPSGRLVAWDKGTGKAIEPEHQPSVSLIEYPLEGVSGPIWVKGGIPVESSGGGQYEARNRQTLCRCGASENKPFCDGSHISEGFNDGDRSVEKGRASAIVRIK